MKKISIHAPRVGSDRAALTAEDAAPISIHAPRVGSDDSRQAMNYKEPKISIHAPRVGSDSKGAQFLGVTFGEKRDF